MTQLQPKKYRCYHPVIDAIQVTPQMSVAEIQEVCRWCGGEVYWQSSVDKHNRFLIVLPNDDGFDSVGGVAKPGDWIICSDSDKSFSVMKNSHMAAMYVAVEPDYLPQMPEAPEIFQQVPVTPTVAAAYEEAVKEGDPNRPVTKSLSYRRGSVSLSPVVVIISTASMFRP